MPSSATSTSRSRRSSPRGSRSSRWTPRRRNWSGTSRTAGGNGSRRASRSRSTSTTSPTRDLGKAIPYGIYDVGRNAGLGQRRACDHDTAELRGREHPPVVAGRWGRTPYPRAERLLICADGGGSNGYRVRLWKVELQRFADETGLAVTVCHLPARDEQVEQDRASAVRATSAMNWRGRPLISHEVIVELIGATTTADRPGGRGPSWTRASTRPRSR